MSSWPHTDLLHVETAPDGLLVKICCPEYDETNAQGIAAELFEIARARGEHVVYLDLDEVEYLSSSMLGGLILLDRKLQDAGGRLTVFNARPQVYELFLITRLNDILDVHERGDVGAGL